MSRVLALKYRPKCFGDLIGQEAISQTLSLGLKTEKLSHAYLFSGLRGSGKTSTARIFAKALVCENAPTAEPCGECAGCVLADEGRHLDIIEMDAASNRGIDDIRQLIESTKYKPSIAKYKIYIIDEVHMLSTPAFNALLKTLEEPPSYVKFILATTDPIKLPPTILSRTVHFRFKKIGQSKVVEHLKHILDQEGIAFEDEALELIARNGSGSLRDTLTLLDQAIVFSKGFVSSMSVVELLGAVNPDKIRELFDCIFAKDRDGVLQFVKEFEAYEGENVINEIIEFLKISIVKKNKNIPLFAIERFFRIAINAKELLYIGADSDFVLTLTLLKMIEALEIEEIDSLIAKYEGEIDFSQIPTKEQGREQKVQQETPPKTTAIAKDKWDRLIESLYERSHEVGSAFEENIAFVSFENNVLTWISNAKDDKYELLKKYYSQIKHIVQDVYGLETTIVVQKEQNIKENSAVVETTQTIGADNSSSEDEPKSLDVKVKEFSLLKHPLVEKTKEVFGVTDGDISVFQKV